MSSFLIHAREDKPRLAPVVRRLIAAGVRLWIDEPRDLPLGLSNAEIAHLSGSSVPGRDWSSDRDAAMHQASSFLVAVSADSVREDRVEIRVECFGADFRARGANVPIFPIGLAEGELERGGSLTRNKQGFKTFVEPGDDGYVLTARGEIETDLLIQALLKAQAAPSRPAARHDLPVSPYFADRTAQTQDLAFALRRARDAQAGPLQLPVLIGTRRDRPETFARDYLPQKLLPALLRVQEWGTARIRWPHCLRQDPERALAYLIDEIIGEDGELTPETVLHAQPPAADLGRPGGLRMCLELWCRAWSDLSRRADTSRIVPVLDIRSETLPLAARLTSFSRGHLLIGKAIGAVEDTISRLSPPVALLPLAPLGRISPQCAEDWLDDELQGHMDRALADRLRAVLLGSVRASGLVMEDWASHARDSYAGLFGPEGRAA